MIRIKLTGKALQDLADGMAFYEDQDEGIGDYFARTLESEIERLKITAGIHSKPHADYHRIIVRRFPYSIFYTFTENTAVIWAVVDCRRNPDWIRIHLEE
jgi:plasmid stabilization system protein ParE